MLANELCGVIEIKEYVVDRIYRSKRNMVYSIKNTKSEKRYVVKEYASQNGKSKDVFFLKLLKSYAINVPEIFYEGSRFILMEELENNTLLDAMIRLEEDNVDPEGIDVKVLFMKVFKWLHDFYHVMKGYSGKHMIFGDANFRNFIVLDEIYGLDFEDVIEGEYITDVARICAHLLRYSPEDTPWKKRVCNYLIELLCDSYLYDRKTLIEEIDRQLEIIDYRRQLKDSSQLENPNIS